MTEKEKAARIRAVGEPAGRMKNHTEVKKVKCQGCGEYIASDEDLTEVEYVKTKRMTDLFFHHGCMNNVWKHGIC